MRPRGSAILALIFLTCLGSSTAVADELATQKTKARELYERAKVHYRSGELEKAASEFKQSYEAYPKPETLFNLAQTHRLLKNYERSIFYYKQYLSSAELTEQDRKLTRERISDLENLVKQQQQAQSAPPQGPEPPSVAGQQSSPPHGPVTQPMGVEKQSNSSGRRPWYGSTTGWVLSGLGVASLATATGLLGATVTEHNLAVEAHTQQEFDLHHGASIDYQKGGWPLLAVGAVLVVGGTVAFALHAKGGR
jgi:tetratricopeptide (TPR) repeat protein